MKALGLVLTTVVTAAFAGSAAGLMLDVPIEEVAANSDAIVRGRVLAQQSYWVGEPRIIVTDVTLEATEVWAGQMEAGQQFSVRVFGGRVGNMEMIQEHQPRFATNEDVVLFLRQPEPDPQLDAAAALNTDVLLLNHAEQGKYVVSGALVVGFKRDVSSLLTFRANVRRMARDNR